MPCTSAPSAESSLETSTPAPASESAPTSLTGRAAFVVDTSAVGIVVRTAFVGESGQVLELPAVFPDLGYALQQIDHLRQIVIERFAQAAQVGVQVIAAQGQTQVPNPVPAEAVGVANAQDTERAAESKRASG